MLGVGAVVLRADSVCLVRRAHPPSAGQWSLPGGKVEHGETLSAALRREVREETGLDVEVGELVEVVEILDDGHYVVLDYVCHLESGELSAGDDAAAAAWVPIANLSAYHVSDAVLRVVREALRRGAPA